MSRVVLAMSGGVDSSVAASLLVRSGHEVIGVFMRHGAAEETSGSCQVGSAGSPSAQGGLTIVQPAGHKQGCCSAEDADDARRIAAQLGIPFYPLNLQSGFARIMDYFVEEYVRGRTPNPCVMCNNWLKFGRLFDYADQIGAQYVATGHYARLVADPTSSTPHLLRGVDRSKDQSYVLFGVARDRLARMLLPVGEFHKPEIRRMAGELGMRVADKKDSQEICFVPSGDHGDFVAQRRGDRQTAGRFVTTDGRVLGQHGGIERYTVGQRRGLGVALGEPYYVIRIEAQTGDVVLGLREELACRGLIARQVQWLVDPPDQPLACLVQVRYRAVPLPALVSAIDGDSWQVDFQAPCLGVAPGQAAVWYDGNRVLGGGWIDQSLPSA